MKISDNMKYILIMSILFTLISFSAVFGVSFLSDKKFEVGSCYILKSDDPFRESEIIIKVVDKKDGYIKYSYSSIPNKYTSSHTTLMFNFEKTECKSEDSK